ncbi:hypothetical protein GZH47_18415 [Paenibacillus rhizovicinus]|uniref:Uncharacterized protein n=1 Tax=Paenibacillus rhizovicinus TaxID=2704463 RepID=A0A6C0P433_9BACL|nr:DUF6470 family protein [Paenibacillus rhizovicinus]QHW32593.1 hypothetical protein GZH47_18415 [Paenibacillus rhizovicinus]
MRLPMMQIESQRGLIGIETQRAQYHIQSQQADLQIETKPTQLNIHTSRAEMHINQDRTWAALTGGNPLEFMHRIYSQMPNIALQGIANIVEKWNRIGDLRTKQNPIPEIAFEAMNPGRQKIQYFGPASCDNVDISFTVNKPSVQVEEGKVDVRVQMHKPDVQYERGDVRIYMRQNPELTITPPRIDMVV